MGLMEAVERYNPDTGVAFSLYALHRVRGRMIDFLQKNGRELLLEDGQEEQIFFSKAGPDTAFETADRNSLHMKVSQAVDRLPVREQDVIRSVYLKEQTAQETADALDVSTAYVYRLEKEELGG